MSLKKIREQYTRVYSKNGYPIHEKKGWIYEDGNLKWVTKEKVNTYALIQAEKDAVELHSILKRYENGDDSALDKVQGMYMDMVDLPSNYAELFSAVSRAEDVFYNMPTDIREKYHNNAAEFWKNYGSEAFDDLVNSYRADVYKQYGMIDPEPVNTVKDFANDREKVKKAFSETENVKVDEKGVVENESEHK